MVCGTALFGIAKFGYHLTTFVCTLDKLNLAQ